MKMFSDKSLRVKINVSIFTVMLVVTIVFGSVLALYEADRRKDVVQQIGQSLDDLTRQYGTQLGNEIFASQVLAVSETLHDVKKRKNILSVTAYSAAGIALASTDERLPSDIDVKESGSSRLAQGRWNRLPILTYTSPIIVFDETVGFWRIRYALDTLNQQTIEIIAIFSTLILSLVFLIGFLLNRILSKVVLDPVCELRDAMHYIEQNDDSGSSEAGTHSLERLGGSFDKLSERLNATSTARDEIGALASAFRNMLVSLSAAYAGIRTDSLTLLYNRVKLDEVLTFETRVADRHHSPFSVILIDIDHFKKVNDTYGHLTGDGVLKAVAEILKDNLRESDLAGRWGGEEFMILLARQSRGQAGILVVPAKVGFDAPVISILESRIKR